MEDREEPLRVGPYSRGFAETGGRCQPRESLERVFVGKLGDDFFAVAEAKFPAADADSLFAFAHEVHLDAAFALIINRAMFPALYVEVRAELAICADEQVQIERGSHTGAVVVGGFENRPALLQVAADNEPAVFTAELADAPQKIPGYRRLEVADGRTRKKNRDVIGFAQG